MEHSRVEGITRFLEGRGWVINRENVEYVLGMCSVRLAELSEKLGGKVSKQELREWAEIMKEQVAA